MPAGQRLGMPGPRCSQMALLDMAVAADLLRDPRNLKCGSVIGRGQAFEQLIDKPFVIGNQCALLAPLGGTAERIEHAAAQETQMCQAAHGQLHPRPEALTAQRVEALAALQESQALDTASNAVVALVRAGRLEEAEQSARELLVNYPDVPDGYDRLGMVQEARGQLREAADSYRKVLEMVQSDPESYDPGYSDMFNDLIAKLDAPTADVDPIREPQFD